MRQEYKFRFRLLFPFLSVLLLLQGCNQCDLKETLYDIRELEDKLEKDYLDLIGTDFDYDSKSFTITTIFDTSDGMYYYYGNSMKINLSNGQVGTICQKPGCLHDINDTACFANAPYTSPLATKEGVYYSSKMGLYLLQEDGSINLKYRRNEFTPREINYSTNAGMLFCNQDKIYMMYDTGFQIYDRELEKTSSLFLLEIPGVVWGAATDGDCMLVINDTNELFRYQISTDQIEKIDDCVTRVFCYHNRFYYSKVECNSLNLYSWNTAATTLVLEDCYVNYQMKDSWIIYQKYSDYSVHMFCQETGENILLSFQRYDIETGTYCSPKNWYSIITNDSLNGIIFASFLNKQNSYLYSIRMDKLDQYKSLEIER